MSHSKDMSTSTVRIRRDSSVVMHRTSPAITIKFIQVVVGVICFGIATNDIIGNFQDLAARSAAVISGYKLGWVLHAIQNIFRPFVNFDYVFIDQLTCRIVFLTVTTIFMIISLVQLTWFPASIYAGTMKSRIISGVLYHLTGFVLHLLASLFVLGRISLLGSEFYNVDVMRLVAIIGVVNAALYLLNTILALWTFLRKSNRRKILSFDENPSPFLHSLPN